jgi:hypothetical protein
MKLNTLLIVSLILVSISCIGVVSISGTGVAEILVQPGGSIQAAVNSANSGDTIIVEPGTYVGNIDISKTNNLNDLVS